MNEKGRCWAFLNLDSVWKQKKKEIMHCNDETSEMALLNKKKWKIEREGACLASSRARECMYKAESEHSWWQLIVHSCDQLWLLVIWEWLACLYMTLWISMHRSAKFILKRTQQISASPHYHIKNYYWISFMSTLNKFHTFWILFSSI